MIIIDKNYEGIKPHPYWDKWKSFVIKTHAELVKVYGEVKE